jgi:hypothetical protein
LPSSMPSKQTMTVILRRELGECQASLEGRRDKVVAG